VFAAPSARSLLNAGLVAGLAALAVSMYAGIATGLAVEWTSSPDASYGWILAAVALLLAWRRRRLLVVAAGVRASLGALVLLTFGLACYLVGLLGADIFLTRISMVPVLAGGVWFVAGRAAARALAVPFFFLLIAVPLPALVVNAITLPLQLVASRIAEGLLAVGGVPVFRDGNILELRSMSLEVAEACSGLRSLISLAAISCLVAWATEHSLARRVLVVAASLPIAIALNAVRIAATGFACEVWGREATSPGWHEFTGWLTFVVAVAVLVQFQRLLPTSRASQRGLVSEMVSA
jgi:exosortase